MSKENIKNFLKENKDLIEVTDQEISKLKDEGYVLLKRDSNFWNRNNVDIADIRKKCDHLISEEKDSAGFEGKIQSKNEKAEEGAHRLTNLLGKDECFKNLISIPDVIYSINQILEKDFQLSSLDMREPLLNSGEQNLHLDWQQRKNIQSTFFQCSAFILLDDVSEDNGPLRLIPKSHKDLVHIKSTSIEPDKRNAEDHKIISEYDKKFSKKILGNAGDIVILNISVFHGGTKNISGKRRRIIFANYRDSNLRTQIDHYKYIPKTKHDNFNNFQKSILSLYKKDLITNFRRWLWERRSWGVVKLIYKIGKKIRN
tara:strand:- start:2 stop:943 length:942 start_codon:yes stop_codon:yes gene_type:complete